MNSTITLQRGRCCPRFWLSALLLIGAWWPLSRLSAQCTMICNNLVSVGLDATCQGEVLYDMVLEDPNNPNICTPNGPTNFLVEVFDQLGNLLPTSPVVTANELGQVLTVRATHIPSGNFCTTTLVVEDNLGPQLTCPPDVTIQCTWSNDPALTGTPTVDDCVDFTLSYSDLYQNNGCTDPMGQTQRTWSAVDDYGNSSSCVQTIYVALPQTAQIVFPPDYNDQDQPALDCANPQTDTAFTGQPTIGGVPVTTGGQCQMSVSFSDQAVQGCGNTFTIQRTWTVVNWCNGQIVTHVQTIAIKDKEAPVIDCPAQLTVGTNYPGVCMADALIPPSPITDNCATTFDVSLFGPTGVVNSNGGTLTGLPLGQHTLTWQAVDPCGNVGTCTTQLEVVDDLAPTTVCDEITTVSLGTNGTAVVNATTFDDGSYDNCCLAGFEVRRMTDACGTGTDFGASVTFCCADAGDTVQVEMRALDCNGNAGSCMVQVIVMDETPPAIGCPPDLTINCTDDATDTNLTGLPNTFDNCGADTTFFADQANLNSCGTGTIARTWTVVDAGGLTASCTQTITVVDNTPVVVAFPPDYTLTTCLDSTYLHPDSLPAPYDGPTFTGKDCELLAVSHTDTYFPVADNACFKIVRTWEVIDWCVWDPADPTGAGYYSGQQVLKVIDTDPPVITCPADLSVAITDSTCAATVVLPELTEIVDCSPETTVAVSSDFGDGLGPFDGVAPGTYQAVYTVNDGCGNSSSCAISISVSDEKPPAMYCINGLVVELMPVDTNGDGFFDTGMIEIWASDFDAGSHDNCSADVAISFSPDTSFTSMMLGCDSLGQIPLEIWGTDAAGNQDFCQTYVIVQDNNGACVPVPPSIAGAIADEMGQPVAEVVVGINGGMSAFDTTDADGAYLFPVVPPASDYTVTPYKNNDIHNGVSTLDALLIRKHLLGLEPLGSPLKMIAADVNNSKSLSISDMIAIRRVVLWEADTFPYNTAWRFVDADYQFQQPQNPLWENWPEVYNINNLLAPMMDVDFTAIKVGDVNNTAAPNPLVASEDRTGGVMPIRLVQQSDGGSTVVRVFAEAKTPLQALQLTFELGEDAGRLAAVRPGLLAGLDEAHFGWRHLGEGLLTMSYETVTPVRVGDRPLFELVFEGEAPVEAALSSTLTPALAWTADGSGWQLVEQGSYVGTLAVEAWPNPVREALHVDAVLPRGGAVQLRLVDLHGRLLWQRDLEAAAGHNRWQVPVRRLGPGVYLLRVSLPAGLSANGTTRTLKVVVE